MSNWYLHLISKSERGLDYERYLGVSAETSTCKKIFDSGDFIKDWYHAIKEVVKSNKESSPSYTASSDINHLSDYGFEYESAYLHFDSGNPILKYFDRTDPNWYLDTGNIDSGIEFFVPNNKWTWEMLKNYCDNNEK